MAGFLLEIKEPLLYNKAIYRRNYEELLGVNEIWSK